MRNLRSGVPHGCIENGPKYKKTVHQIPAGLPELLSLREELPEQGYLCNAVQGKKGAFGILSRRINIFN